MSDYPKQIKKQFPELNREQLAEKLEKYAEQKLFENGVYNVSPSFYALMIADSLMDKEIT